MTIDTVSPPPPIKKEVSTMEKVVIETRMEWYPPYLSNRYSGSGEEVFLEEKKKNSVCLTIQCSIDK